MPMQRMPAMFFVEERWLNFSISASKEFFAGRFTPGGE